MVKNKVCILAAGRGTRLGEYTQVLNKALLPLDGKAIISHIIRSFPQGTHFVIALGYKGEAVLNYIELAHPGLDVTFVKVLNYDGPESGPGASLLACREALANGPFYFVTCDTYWTNSITQMPADKSWVAVDTVEKSETSHYSTVDISQDGRVSGFLFKQESREQKKEAFTGLAFIKETDIFWSSLESSQMLSGEKQVIEPFQELAKQGLLFSTYIDWVDTGLIEKYRKELKKYGQYDFSKVKEAFYSISGQVIKYFDQDQDSTQRVMRAQLNPEVFPEITGHRKNMYRYKYQPGNTLYENDRPEIFIKLLAWLDSKLWKPKIVEQEVVQGLCDLFYRDKTLARVAQFQKKYPDYKITKINGVEVPSVEALLKNISWDDFKDGVPCFIHGDLQPDNIIYDSEKDLFTLLDWRQNFAGEVAFGDLYYDFAKLWGGLNLNYKEVKNNAFSYSEAGTECSFRYPQHKHFEVLSKELEALAESKRLSVERIHLLVGLIYLNMSPLHHYPFDKMLCALGREILFKAQTKKS